MTRIENRAALNVDDIARISGYHAGAYSASNSQEYARLGFDRDFSIWTTDRFIRFSSDLRTLENGKEAKGYGLEIETECTSIVADIVLANIYRHVIFPKFPAGLFKMQHDGSLGGRSSAECITMPMTREGVRNLYPAFKQMYDVYFPAFGISCTSGNCGMHVNISNACFGAKEATQEEAIRKFYYIINKHFTLMKNLLNRDGSTGYCSRMDASKARTMDIRRMSSDHYVCMNFGHYNAGRVELRLVGGQASFPCFRNTMETVFHLVDAVKKLSWNQLDDIVAVFSGCNQYVKSRIKSHGLERGHVTAEQYAAISAASVRAEGIL